MPPFIAVGGGTKFGPVEGRLGKLGPDGVELRSAGGTARVLDWVSLRQAGKVAPAWPTEPQLITAAGDRVPGRLVGGDVQSLQFRPAFSGDGGTSWKVPFASVAVVWLTTPPADTPADPARYAWRGDERRDALLFRNGDVLRGTLERLTNDRAVSFHAAGDATARGIPLNQLAAIAFNPALARTRKPREAYAHAVLGDGTRLGLTGVASDGKMLTGKALFGSPVEVPLARVVSLDVRQGRVAYLSDLTPKAADQAGFLGETSSLGRDRTVRGEPLRIATPDGDSTFDKGLACRPRCTLTYALDGKSRRFDVLVGLDANSKSGSAVVRVLVDGKDRLDADAGKLTPGRSQSVSVDVSGAKELTLIANFGPTGGVQSDVNWGDARLVE